MPQIKESEFWHRAADQIELGWCKGNLQDDFGNVCALGALNLIRRSLGIPRFSSKLLREKISEVHGDRYVRNGGISSISGWNNAPETQKEDVVNMFRKIAIELEEQGK